MSTSICNIRKLTNKIGELVQVLKKRKLIICLVQETKRGKAREIYIIIIYSGLG